MDFKVVSADNHIIEPRDLFLDRMPARFRDKAPRVLRGADGGDGWTWNGKPIMQMIKRRLTRRTRDVCIGTLSC